MTAHVPQDCVMAGFTDELQRLKRLCESGLAQLKDEDFFFRLNERQNSIAVIVQHLAGNMRSRWTDFLTSDGEKPSRNREGEFVEKVVAREQVMATWNQGWDCVFAALARLHDADLSRIVTIRGERMTAAAAITRQVGHYGWHVGQLLLLAKHILGPAWQYVTIPPQTAGQDQRG
jgi:hypothetical protein